MSVSPGKGSPGSGVFIRCLLWQHAEFLGIMPGDPGPGRNAGGSPPGFFRLQFQLTQLRGQRIDRLAIRRLGGRRFQLLALLLRRLIGLLGIAGRQLGEPIGVSQCVQDPGRIGSPS